MRKWTLLALALLIAGSGGLFASVAAAALPNDGRSAESRVIFFNEQVFRGEGSKQDAFFEIGKGQRSADGSHIELYFSHSETLLPEYSTLTVLLDDVPLGSIALDESNRHDSLWKIDLSSRSLSPGFHKITFWAKMKISALICENPQNSSAWLTIHQKSKVNLQLEQNYDTADLTWYPSPFFERGSPSPLHAAIAVPDDFDDAEFLAAAQLAQFLTRQTFDGKLHIPVFVESELTERVVQSHSVIWIGKTGQWKGKGQSVLQAFADKHRQAAASDGFIGIDASIWNPELTNLILSGTGPKLLNAARILSSEPLYSQLQGASAIVPDKLAAETEEAAGTNADGRYAVTLEELGYANLVTEGVLEGGTTIQYTIPSQWDLSSGAALHLNYKHSGSILYDKSVMTVKLNGVPVQSVKLVEETRNRGSVDIPLAQAVIGANRSLSIDISFQFVNPTSNAAEAIATSNCMDTLLGDWAVVENTSYLMFTPGERESFNLDSLPFPFVSDKRWSPTTVILGDNRSETLNTALTWAGLMGVGFTADSDVRLALASDELQPAELQDRNLVYVGLADRLPAYLNDNAAGYVAFQPSAIVSRSEQVELLPELQRDSAVIQLTSSPLNPMRNLLVLAATDRARLAAIGEVWADAGKSAAIGGRIVAIDNRSEVFAFPATADVRQPAAAKLRSERSFDRPLPYGTYLFAGAAGAVILVLLALLIKFRKRRNR